MRNRLLVLFVAGILSSMLLPAIAGAGPQSAANSVADAALDQVRQSLLEQWPESPGASVPFDEAGVRALFSLEEVPDPVPGLEPFASAGVFDNLSPLDQDIAWDSNGDGRLILEYRGASGIDVCSMRVVVQRTYLASALPRGVVLYTGGDVLSNGGGNNPKIRVEFASPAGAVMAYVAGAVESPEVFENSIVVVTGAAVPPLDSLVPASWVSDMKAMAQDHGRYFTSMVAAQASPIDSVWAPQGGLSGLCVVEPPFVGSVQLPGQSLNTEQRPGCLLVLGGSSLTPGSVGDFYGAIYCEGGVQTPHGNPRLHGMLVAATAVDMRGLMDIMYNDACVANMRWPVAVDPIPGTTDWLDDTPPVTAQTGADGDWHAGDVTISFAAADDFGGSGVDYTEYQLDSGDWTPGDSVIVTGEGTHVVGYRSVDRAGNVESVNTATVRIDMTAPTVDLDTIAPQPWEVDAGPLTVAFTSNEAGRASVEFFEGSSSANPVKTIEHAVAAAGPTSVSWDGQTQAGRSLEPGSYTARVSFRDLAGNEAVTSPVSAMFTVTAAFSAITVTAPTGVTSQAQGESLPVTWTTNAAVSGGEFSLWLVSPSNGWYGGKLVPADGAADYASSLALDVPVGAGYRVFVYYRASSADPWGVYGFAAGTVDVTVGALSSIAVTAPVGSSSYAQGDVMPVSWTPDQAVSEGEFSLWLVSPGNGWYGGKLVPADGSSSYADSVALNVPLDAGYRVFVYYRATPTDSWGVYGFATGAVTVTAPAFSAIAVTAPSGTSTQAQGESLPVTWTTNAAVSGGEFSLWLVSPSNGWYGGKLVPADGAADYASSLALDVPVGAGYRVFVYYRASSADPWGVYGFAAGTVDVTVGALSSIAVTAPVGSSSYAQGDVMPVSWTPDQAVSEGEFSLWLVSPGNGWYGGKLVPADGSSSYADSVALNVPLDAGYRVFVYYRATPTDSWGVYGFATGAVTVTAPAFSAIAVTAPSGTSTQAQGESLPVTWTTNAAVSGGEFSLWLVSPSNGWYGGKLVAADGTADYASSLALDVPVDAGYRAFVYYRASSADPWGVYGFAPGTVDVSAPSPGPTHVSGTIAGDTTWTLAGSPYVVDGTVAVSSGAALTIESGVVVKFRSSTGLSVAGTLVANGTAGSPVTFTSSQASPAPGAWGGIGVSGSSTATLDHVVVSYAQTGVGSSSGSTLSLTNSLVTKSSGNAVSLHSTRTPQTISGCSFTDNAGYWLRASSNNAPSYSLSFLDLAGNSFSGNGDGNAAYIDGVVRGDWQLSASTPYRISSISVIDNARLTIAPGATLRFDNGYGGDGGGLSVSAGTLVANGTAGSPVTFTSSQASPAPGAWGGIGVSGSSTATLDHVVVSYAQTGVGSSSGSTLSLTNSLVTKSSGNAVSLHSTRTPQTISGCSFTDNAGYWLRASSNNAPSYSLSFLDLAGNSFSGNGDGNAAYIDGVVRGDWQLSASTPYRISSISVIDNARLTIAPGATLRFDNGYGGDGGGLSVSAGTLVANGTAGSPVTFTSSQASPAPGAWGGIGVSGSSTATLDHVVVSYAQTGVGSSSSTVALTNSSIVWSSNLGLSVSGTGAVAASGNWWGSASGPAPYGTGNGVSTHTEYDAFGHPYTVVDANVIPWVGYGQTTSHSYGTSAGWSAYAAEPVNVVLGNYTYEATDLAFGSRGLPTTVKRSYNSLDSEDGPFGPGWTHAYNVGLSVDGVSGDVTVRNEDGRRDLFTRNGDGSYAPPDGVFATLTRQGDGSYVLVTKERVTLAFTAAGRLTQLRDRNGNATALSYDGSGRLTSVTDAVGRAITLSYNPAGRIAQVVDPIGRSYAYAYSADGRLTGVTDAMGHVTAYRYDAAGYLDRVTDANGHYLVRNTYDASGRVIEQLDARGAKTTFLYQPADHRTYVTDPLANTAVFEYDAQYRMTRETDPLGHSVGYAYDANGYRSSVTDKRGMTTAFEFDARGNLLRKTDPLGGVSTASFNSTDDMTAKTDELGRTFTFSFDAKGNLLTTTDPLGGTTANTYTAYGETATSTDAAGSTQAFSYDAEGNRTGATNALGRTTHFAYDAVGRTVSQTDPLGHATSFAYDADDRLTQTTDALGSISGTAYDAVGNKSSETDANGRVTSYAHDEKDELVQVTDAAGGVVAYAYDAVGNRTRVTDANGHATSFEFDALGRVTRETDSLGRVRTTAYDPAGAVASRTDARGRTTTYTYDALGRLTRTTYAGASTVSFAYDAVGNRTAMTDAIGAWGYAYDALNRATSVTDPAGRTVSYAYDAAGRLRKLTYPAGQEASYAYDAGGRLASVTDWAANATSYGYDDAGRATSVTRPNGVVTTAVYDAVDRLTAQVDARGASTLQSLSYVLDPSGRRLSMTDASGTTTYTYDAAYRLTGVAYPGGRSATYSYDAGGNRTRLVDSAAGTTDYTYDAVDQLLTAGAATFTYDANGSRVSRTAGGMTTTYSYDFESRLTGVASPTSTATYAYSGDGLRTAKTVDGVTTSYVWDASPLLPETLTATTAGTTTRYLYGGALLAQQDAGGFSYLHRDGLGSTRLVSDASGAAGAAVAYDAFGAITGGGQPSSFLYTGQQLDPESGLYYLRARTYDPAVGRFLQRDAVVGAANDTQSLNRYAYCENDPVNVVDPSGRFGWSTIKGWGGSAASAVRQVGGEVRSAASYVANEVKNKGFYGAAKSIWSMLTSAYSGSSAYTDARCANSSGGSGRSTSGYYGGGPSLSKAIASKLVLGAGSVYGAAQGSGIGSAMSVGAGAYDSVTLYRDLNRSANSIRKSSDQYLPQFSDPNADWEGAARGYYSGTYGSILDVIKGHGLRTPL